MTIQRLAVFSGISSKVVGKIAPSLRSMGTEVAFVKLESGRATPDYLDRLLDRVVDVVARARAPDVKILGILVSAIQPDLEIEERARFFPALRRFAVDPVFRADINRGQALVQAIMNTFSSEQFEVVARATAPQQDARLLLPLRNVGVERLRRHFANIYEMRASIFTRRLERDIMKMKKGLERRAVNMIRTLPL